MDHGLVGQNGQFVVVLVMAVLDQGHDHAVTQYHCVIGDLLKEVQFN
jgi:hypothetical protein